MLIQISDSRAFSPFETIPGSLCWDDGEVMVSPRTIRQMKNPNDLWNCLTFLNEQRILVRGLGEAFSGILLKIFDCQAFSPFEAARTKILGLTGALIRP